MKGRVLRFLVQIPTAGTISNFRNSGQFSTCASSVFACKTLKEARVIKSPPWDTLRAANLPIGSTPYGRQSLRIVSGRPDRHGKPASGVQCLIEPSRS